MYFFHLQESAESFITAAVPGAEKVTHFTTTHKGPEFGVKVVRITMTERCQYNFAKSFRQALKDINFLPLEYDFVDKGPKTEAEQHAVTLPGPSVGKSKIVEALDMFIYSLSQYECRYRRGHVYQLNRTSSTTFEKKWDVRTYMGLLCTMQDYRDILTPQLGTVSKFLDANPEYKGIDEVHIDYNLVEVRNYHYFSYFSVRYVALGHLGFKE